MGSRRCPTGFADVSPSGAEVYLNQRFCPAAESKEVLSALKSLPKDWWEVPTFVLFGKECRAHRYVTQLSDAGIKYKYSGYEREGYPFPKKIRELKEKIENALPGGLIFNYCLVNRYDSGTDYMGLHSDDEKEMDPDAPIVSLSFGTPRYFDFQHKKSKAKTRLELNCGSALIMAGKTQKLYKHGVPIQKVKKSMRQLPIGEKTVR